MIQRIQTLWLLLAACCMGLCLAVPIANYAYADRPADGQRVEARLDLIARGDGNMLSQMDQPVVNYAQRLTGMETWPLMVIGLACVAIALGAIFLYRRRTLQVRLVGLGFLFNVVYAFLVFFWAVDRYAGLLADGMGGERPEVSWALGAYAPLASIVFLFLAQRAIRKDEAMVRAADRLR